MDRIIKSEDRSYSIENIQYVPFEEGSSQGNALDELPPEKILEIRNLINDAKDEAEERVGILRNVTREDGEPHESGVHTEKLLGASPNRKDNYVQVKKIL